MGIALDARRDWRVSEADYDRRNEAIAVEFRELYGPHGERAARDMAALWRSALTRKD